VVQLAEGFGGYLCPVVVGPPADDRVEPADHGLSVAPAQGAQLITESFPDPSDRRFAGFDQQLAVIAADVEPQEVEGAPRGAMRKEMTDEQHLIRTGWSAGPGLMQRPGEAGGQSRRGSARQRRERPRQRDGRAALPDARVRASETERRSESKVVLEAPRFLKRPETWRTWVVDSNGAALFDGGTLHARLSGLGAVTDGTLRVPGGRAVGVEPVANPVKRIMVNVGSAPDAPGCWWQPGKARCLLMRRGRDGGVVVLRGRESRPHREGRQQDRNMRSRSGGRA